MSPLLQQVLTEIDRLEPREQLSIMSHLVDRLASALPNRFNSCVTPTAPKTDQPPKISRQELLGCASGLISMRADFDEPLADFQDYI
jgi:Protein of unknown function (DUF2281)